MIIVAGFARYSAPSSLLVLPHDRTLHRASSATIFPLLIAVVYGGSVELMSRPKPLRLERRDVIVSKVIGATVQSLLDSFIIESEP
jgi:hypothetical protein